METRLVSAFFDKDPKKIYSGYILVTGNTMVKKLAKKSVTIDDLALMVQRGFLGVDEKFQDVEERMQKGFQNVDEKFQGMDEKFQGMEQRFDELKEELKMDIATLQVTVNRIDTRTQNQVDAVYEETSVLKNDMKTAKEDIILIKTHIGLPVE